MCGLLHLGSIEVQAYVVQGDIRVNCLQVGPVTGGESSGGSLCHRGQQSLTILRYSPAFDSEAVGVNITALVWIV